MLASPSKLAAADTNAPLPGTYVDFEAVPERDQRVIFEDPGFQDWIETVVCSSCGGGDNEEQLLLCDRCDKACHTYCAGLDGIPEGEWYCAECCQESSARVEETRRRHPSRNADAARRAGRVRAENTRQGRREAPPQQTRRRSGNTEVLSDFIVSDGDDESDPDEDWNANRSGARRRRQQPEFTGNNELSGSEYSLSVEEDVRDRGVIDIVSSDDEDEDVPLSVRLFSTRPLARNSSREAIEGQRQAGLLRDHWAHLRSGQTSFAAVRAQSGRRTSAEQSGRPPQRRRRLRRAGELEAERQPRPQRGGQDLETISIVSPEDKRADGGDDETRSWAVVDSLRNHETAENEEDVPLAVRLRRQLAQARDVGSRLPSNRPLNTNINRFRSPTTPASNSSHGRRLRTVGQMVWGADAVRGQTPGSGERGGRGSGGRGVFVIPRLANSPIDQAALPHNPFNRYNRQRNNSQNAQTPPLWNSSTSGVPGPGHVRSLPHASPPSPVYLGSQSPTKLTKQEIHNAVKPYVRPMYDSGLLPKEIYREVMRQAVLTLHEKQPFTDEDVETEAQKALRSNQSSRHA